MLGDAIYDVVFWYVLFVIPYILICTSGAGRVRDALWIAALPALLSAYVTLGKTYPEIKVLERDYPNIDFAILLVTFAVTFVALHRKWRQKWPSMSTSLHDSEAGYSVGSCLSSMPMIGIFVAYPLGIALAIHAIWKKRRPPE